MIKAPKLGKGKLPGVPNPSPRTSLQGTMPTGQLPGLMQAMGALAPNAANPQQQISQ